MISWAIMFFWLQWFDKLDHSFWCYFDRHSSFSRLQWIDKLDHPFQYYFDSRINF